MIGSAKGFSSGGPGKGMHSRAVTNLLAKYSYVDGASAVNAHFSDSGLFGMSIEGPGSHSKDLLGRLIDELNALKAPIDETELNRAKNIGEASAVLSADETLNITFYTEPSTFCTSPAMATTGTSYAS